MLISFAGHQTVFSRKIYLSDMKYDIKTSKKTFYQICHWSVHVRLNEFSKHLLDLLKILKWAASSEFVSSSIPSWQISTGHAQPFRGARDLAFCLKVPLDPLFVWASSEGSGETARMRRLAWTFAARICDKYQIRLTRSKCSRKAKVVPMLFLFCVVL